MVDERAVVVTEVEEVGSSSAFDFGLSDEEQVQLSLEVATSPRVQTGKWRQAKYDVYLMSTSVGERSISELCQAQLFRDAQFDCGRRAVRVMAPSPVSIRAH